MNLRFSSGGGLVLAAVLWANSSIVAWAQGSPKDGSSRAGGVSPTNTTLAIPAPQEPVNRRDGLQQLEDDLSKWLGSFSRKGSLDGLEAPPYQAPVAPSVRPRRAKDDAERWKGWLFLGPDDAALGALGQDPLGPAALGTEKIDRKRGSLEQLYYQLFPQHDGGSGASSTRADDAAAKRKAAGARQDDGDEDADMPGSIRAPTQKLKKLLGSESSESIFAPDTRRGLTEGFFGLRQDPLSPERELAHKEYMQKYRQMLDAPSAGSTAPNPLGAPEAGSATAATGGLLGGVSGSSRHATETTPGNLNSFSTVGTLPDQNRQVLNQWNSLYTPPRTEPPKLAPVTVPQLEIPKRKF